MILRDYVPGDCKALAELFYDTVHKINARDYSQEQLNAWATGRVDLEEWNRSFLSHHTVVAEIDGTIVGFGDMDDTGYLDRLYVHAGFQRRGIASAICGRLEEACHAEKITTHASVTAREFFEKRGYKIVSEQQVERRGILLTNYVMERRSPLIRTESP